MKKSMLITLLTAALLLLNTPLRADEKSETEELVNESLQSLENFSNDPDMKWFRDHLKTAKGILIIPRLYKAAFLFGGSGGTGVLLRHNTIPGQAPALPENGWSNPAFFTMVSLSAGAQAGIEAAEVMLVIMTDKGMDALLSTKLQLGVDASIALGPIGTGLQAATTDILQYTRAKGIFAGLTFEGAVISPRDSLNEIYFGSTVDPMDILVKGTVENPQANALRARLADFK